MNFASTILSIAKLVGVNGSLLLAICTQETGLRNVVVYEDGNSASLGVCQIKKNTAEAMGFHGPEVDLLRPENNILFSAKYLKYQLERYDGNWMKATAAYNSGSFLESGKMPGYPINLGYVRSVQKLLPGELRGELDK